ncbi:cysteine proteinase [Ascodesmis nigricans]|uniref:Cysteine proteinase n=1 Tax=Ascodesmis nigricans TaxID=341454 RepID=A0A4S2N1I1_9PEZI|nr:cysteine proteinase [Ascodesmis nigricans]
MSKRPADEPLDVLEVRRNSPASATPKRLRSEDYDGGDQEHQSSLPTSADTEDDDHLDEEPDLAPQKPTGPAEGFSDLYLDTVNRALLDFDFEKLCSISLSNINVYACLVCGKYFQGRGKSSHAYTHSLDQDHHVFINMASLNVYILPESYEVKNKTLDDIKYVVNPTYTKEDVRRLDREEVEKTDLGKKKYIPGFVGLNNIKQNDYVNVVVHALAHVVPLRNYFMLEDLRFKPELAQRLSTLIRKVWNPRAFKSHVSPHELLQEISLRSSKKFTLLQQSDPVDFTHWFLNNLHLALGGSKTKPQSSIIQQVFQGKLKLESQAITAKADASDRLRFEEAGEIKTQVTRFMVLTLDLPPKPIFRTDDGGSEGERNIIPQVPLTTILRKYDGLHPQELQGMRRRYRLLHPLPPYLMFHIKRFTQNKFVAERNNTIVTFNPRSLDMSPFVEPGEKMDMGEPILYDLVANITHETVVETGKREGELKSVYKVQLLEKARGKWFEIQDLVVKEVARELLFTSESYVQIWEKRRVGKREGKA